MSSLKPMTLYAHHAAPNPYKVCMVLSALNLAYAPKYLDFSEVKTPDSLAINPNGRLPTLVDPNTDITLWESGAIIEYLVETYDTGNEISYPTGTAEYWQAKQWLAFQISGQGPYYGQATWFARFHPEKIQSATDRYVNEIFRVMSVLELQLSRNKIGWLVGDKCTYADLSFVTWCSVGEGLLRELGKWEGVESKYPEYVAWLARSVERREVQEVREKMAKGRKALGLKP